MKISDFSQQFSEVWGENATSDTITFPIPSTTTTSGWASLDAGFTSVNMTVLAAGGIPPFGQDFNGILKMLSTSAQNYESGNVPVWSSDFATDISGYPQYALVQYGGTYYTSSTDDNTTTPGASGSEWVGLLEGYATETYVEQGIVAGLGLAKYNSDPGYSTLPGGMIIQYGTSASGSEGGGSVSFPIAFPSACISVTISEDSAGATWPGTGSGGEPTVHGLQEAPGTDSFTTYSMRWTGSSWVGQNGLGFSWQAIGY